MQNQSKLSRMTATYLLRRDIRTMHILELCYNEAWRPFYHKK